MSDSITIPGYGELKPLNTALLSDLVTWAMDDQNVIDRMSAEHAELAEKFAGWGSWDQGRWATETRNGVCNTAYCIAGQASAQVGFVPILEPVATYDEDEDGVEEYTVYNASQCAPRRFKGLDDKGRIIWEADTDQGLKSIREVGQEAIGILPFESDALFEGSNSLGKVITVARMCAKARGQELNLPPEWREAVENTYTSVDSAEESVLEEYYFPPHYKQALSGKKPYLERLRAVLNNARNESLIDYDEWNELAMFLNSETERVES
jgi:hypothetical protein